MKAMLRGFKKIIMMNLLFAVVLLAALEVSFSCLFCFKDVKGPLTLSDSVIDFPYTYYTFSPSRKGLSAPVNDDGLYTPYTRQKGKDVFRIALMGGSTVRSMFAQSYDSTISAVLERLLRNKFPQKNIEVVNAGMSGYVTEQMFIYYQLVVSKYSPDIVVGLNGYNDLMSVKLNRGGYPYFAPQNMRQFQVIREGKMNRTLAGGLNNIFPAISRAAGYIRGLFSAGTGGAHAGLNVEEVKNAASDYISIIKDTHAFCEANGVAYFEFLQPVKWYVKGNKDESMKKGASAGMFELYAAYEEGLAGLDYGYSLTGLFRNSNSSFIDDCHFIREGNEAIAGEIARYIEKNITIRANG